MIVSHNFSKCMYEHRTHKYVGTYVNYKKIGAWDSHQLQDK